MDLGCYFEMVRLLVTGGFTQMQTLDSDQETVFSLIEYPACSQGGGNGVSEKFALIYYASKGSVTTCFLILKNADFLT